MAEATADAAVIVAHQHRSRGALVLGALAAVLGLAFLLAVGWGAVPIGPGQILAILAAPLGIELPWSYGAREEGVLLAIRLPRACLAVLVGGALAACGASLQGLFRNPLADPGLLGVSAGAAAAAVAVLVLGASLSAALPSPLAGFLLPVAAFGGGLLATLTFYGAAHRDGRVDVATMLLAGVAINAIATAVIGLFIFVSTDDQLRDLNFWLLGGLGGITWSKMAPILPFIAIALLLLPRQARTLNALLLGEGEAFHLGFDVERSKRLIILLIALATGASVALTGVIGFVGLVVPHLVRLVAGPEHRVLLPGSILLGAALLLVADLLARTLVLPAELPIGILTSCVGGPFFLALLIHRRRRMVL